MNLIEKIIDVLTGMEGIGGLPTDEEIFAEFEFRMQALKKNEGVLPLTISTEDLIFTSCEESFFEWHKCPKCDTNGISKDDKFCSGCGVKIVKPKEG